MTQNLMIYECIPRNQTGNEGSILHQFIQMTAPTHVKVKQVKTNNELVHLLEKKDDLRKYEFVHLSGHGNIDSCTFDTPHGSLAPNEFPKNCFKNKVVTLSACELGRSDFINPFMDRTNAKRVIAPMNDIEFVDAAIWYVTFYYWVLEHGMAVGWAYKKTKEYYKAKMNGGLGLWE